MLAFVGVMGFATQRMRVVERQLALINKTYLRLTLILGEVYIIQRALLNTIAERSDGQGTSKFLLEHMKLARRYRLHDVELALRLAGGALSDGLPETDRSFLLSTRQQMSRLVEGFRENERRFDQLFGSASIHALDVDRLMRDENKLLGQSRRLRNALGAQVRRTAVDVERSQRYALWATAGLVLLALAVGVMVTIRSARMLRPLRTLVLGAKRIGSGDYASRVSVSSGDELGELAREFNSMAVAVEERETRLIRSERMAAAGRLASHITHEVRNPLNAISLNTELLEEEIDQENKPDVKALLGGIRREVDRLTEITEEYLRFARLPKPHLELEDANEILRGLAAFCRGEIEAQKIVLKLDLHDQPLWIAADENQLRQALLNIVRNAREAMDQGGVLCLCSSLVGDQVALSVVDQGAGIDQTALASIFEPFFSTKDSGTGLGLPLTQQIVQEHGGVLEVASVLGKGTTFTIRLPLADSRATVEVGRFAK